jgi:hypothetical protein
MLPSSLSLERDFDSLVGSALLAATLVHPGSPLLVISTWRGLRYRPAFERLVEE